MNLRDRREGNVDCVQRSCFDVQCGEIVTTLFCVAAYDLSRGGKAKEAGAENPLGLAKFRFHLAERIEAIFFPSIKIPPASAIRDKIKHAVRRPFGLEDRFIDAAGDLFFLNYSSCFV